MFLRKKLWQVISSLWFKTGYTHFKIDENLSLVPDNVLLQTSLLRNHHVLRGLRAEPQVFYRIFNAFNNIRSCCHPRNSYHKKFSNSAIKNDFRNNSGVRTGKHAGIRFLMERIFFNVSNDIFL